MLAITHRHAQVAAGLPLANRDPWDGILVAQSLVEEAPLVCADGALSDLGASSFW